MRRWGVSRKDLSLAIEYSLRSTHILTGLLFLDTLGDLLLLGGASLEGFIEKCREAEKTAFLYVRKVIGLL